MHAGPNGNQTGPHCSSVSTNVVVPNLIRLVQLLHAAKFKAHLETTRNDRNEENPNTNRSLENLRTNLDSRGTVSTNYGACQHVH